MYRFSVFPRPPACALIGFAALLLATLPASARRNQLLVDDNGLDCFGAAYSNVSAAVAAAEEGDRIVVCPGVYEEQVIVQKSISLVGVPSGSRSPVIRPLALPVSVSSPLSGNPVTAAIILDAPSTRVENLEIDLGSAPPMGCTPMLAGIYIRDSKSSVRNNLILNARPNGRPDCASGVGVLVESSGLEMKVRVDRNEIEGFQKAGVVGTGVGLALRVNRTNTTAAASGTVANGAEVTFGAVGNLKRMQIVGQESPVPGELATGLLMFTSDQGRLRRVGVKDADVGLFVFGHRHKLSRNLAEDLRTDGVVVLGDENLLRGNLVFTSGTAGIFVDGNGNRIRGGLISDTPVGVWLGQGSGNEPGGLRTVNVPTVILNDPGRVISPDEVEPTTTFCSADLDCDDGSVCTVDSCVLATGACSHVNASNGILCDDNDACTGNDQCLAGVCVGAPVADGTPCTDGKFCVINEMCQAGACVGVPFACSDGNVCTADTCDESLDTCLHDNVDEQTPCSDGDVCNGLERCQAGVCMPGANINCEDTDPCTVSSCDPITGCIILPIPEGGACDDAAFCVVGETCQAGLCVGTPNLCDDGNVCTADSCDEGTDTCINDAAALNGAGCPDSDLCNGDETCAAGACLPGAPLVCDDSDPCTVDACASATGCFVTPVPEGGACDDGNFCVNGETCQAGLCVGTPNLCDDANACTADSCDEVADACVNDAAALEGGACDDGNFCVTGETCQAGVCVGSTPNLCDDANACTADSCDEVADACVNDAAALNGAACADGDLCNGDETCAAGVCTAGSPLVCDDGDACTTDSCDALSGCVFVPLPLPCP